MTNIMSTFKRFGKKFMINDLQIFSTSFLKYGYSYKNHISHSEVVTQERAYVRRKRCALGGKNK
jgi:hypothetical protein